MSTTDSHRPNEGIPSIRNKASRAITSASVDEWDVAPCFLHIQVMGTKVLGPTKHTTPPLVDLESLKSEAKLASEKIKIRQSLGGSPTKQTIE